jgi:L-ascorbate metabolism protein UlaG (beta-lactamase superfamily)
MQRPFAKLLRLATGAYATRRSIAGGPGHRGPPSDHFDGTVFRNQNPASTAGRSLGDFLKWQRTSRATPWPRRVANRARPDLPVSLEKGGIAFTFVNHITYLVQFRGLNVLTDPVYSERVSPVQWSGPRRVREPGLAFDALPTVHTVLVSHSHYDHLDVDTLVRLEHAHRPLFLTGLGNRAFLEDHGLGRVRELDWWESVEHEGHRYTYVPAQHWSGRALSGRNRTLWGGFVIESDGRKVYFAGDTGYWDHFRQIRARCGRMDVAMLPIGAYEPRWFMKDMHMNPDDAVRAHLDLEATLSIGTHYGCFQLTDEGIDEPLRELAVARERHGVRDTDFVALETGATFRVRA